MLLTLSGTTGSARVIRLVRAHSALRVRTRPGSHTTLLIDLAAKGKNVRAIITFAIAPRSKLRAVFLWRGKGTAVITQRSNVGAGASLRLLNITEGSCTHEYSSDVAGRDGESELQWIVHASGNRQCALSSSTTFRAKGGRGTVTLHGVAEDQAQIKATGAIGIPRSGSGTQTKLTQKILLLDPAARAQAIPELKVETNDVQAGHSASVSRIHPEDLFYLSSRGIGPKKARSLLIRGFLDELLSELPEETLRLLRNGAGAARARRKKARSTR